jgi:hypothetical protein
MDNTERPVRRVPIVHQHASKAGVRVQWCSVPPINSPMYSGCGVLSDIEIKRPAFLSERVRIRQCLFCLAAHVRARLMRSVPNTVAAWE